MTAYAVAIIRETKFCSDIRKYLEQIDQTLRPYSGRFRIHGGPYDNVESTWNGDLVMIEFPNMEKAKQWYNSPQYQVIQPLRAANTSGELFSSVACQMDIRLQIFFDSVWWVRSHL